MFSRIPRPLLVGVLAIVMAFITTSVSAGEAGPVVTDQERQVDSPAVTLVERQVIRPRRLVIHRARFTPWARPTPAQVNTIIDVEARGSSYVRSVLRRRIACESGFRWWAGNGPYQGLGQFHASTFARGFSSIGSRRVRWVSERVRMRRTRVIRRWSDGTVTRGRGARRPQRVRMIRTGVIPVGAGRLHGWAQVRIMARAIRGQGGVRDSEWECR